MGPKYLKFNSTWGFKEMTIRMISLGIEFNSLTKRKKADSKVKINVLHGRERIILLLNLTDIHKRGEMMPSYLTFPEIEFQQKVLYLEWHTQIYSQLMCS